MGIDDLDGGHRVAQHLGRHTPVAVEGELHVLGRHDVAVVELHAPAQDELVAEPVSGHAPRLGQARGHGLAGHRLHERVVQGVVREERRDALRMLAGIEPDGRDGEMHGPGDLALGGGVRGCGGERGGQGESGQGEKACDASVHGGLPPDSIRAEA